MPRAAASGSGEPLERSDYRDGATLPRSGLLEQRHAGDAQQRRCACCCVPLMPGVRARRLTSRSSDA
jgi:hypothetical protein